MKKTQLRIDGGTDELREPDPDTPNGRPARGAFKLDTETPLIVDTARLGAVLGISARRVQQLVGDGLPKHGRGRYDLEAVVPWYVAHVEKKVAPEDGSMLEAQRRYYAARATAAETAAAKTTGQAFEAGEVRAMLADFAIAIRHAAEAAPSRLFTDEDDQNRARQIADAILEALADAAQDVAPRERNRRGTSRAAPTA